MDRLFWRGLVLPDLYSDGSCLWIGHYGNDVDDHYFAVFLLAPKQEDPFLGTVHHALFAAIEGIFFISSATKFFHGGYVAILLASVIIGVMLIWEWGNRIQENVAEEVALSTYIPQLKQLREDDSLPLSQTNVVFMVPKLQDDQIGQQFIYSILDKRPKRAKVYWFVNVEVTDEPYTKNMKFRWQIPILSLN